MPYNNGQVKIKRSLKACNTYEYGIILEILDFEN